MVCYVPQAIGFGAKSGKSEWMAFIDSNSPCTMFLPTSFESTFTKKTFGVPSANSTSIRAALAQKLTPWHLVDTTRQPSGSSGAG